MTSGEMNSGEMNNPATSDDAQQQVVLFLQGPISPFFSKLATKLEAAGARVLRVNLCFGDWLLWRRAGGVNYRGKPVDWPAFITDLITREAVTDVVLLGEQRDYHQAAIQAAQAAGANVIATDFGYLRPDWIAFELDGLTGASRFQRDPQAIRALAAVTPPIDLDPQYRDPFWSMAWADIYYHISSWALWLAFPGYRSHQPDHPIITYLGTGLRMMLQPFRTRAATAEIAEAERAPGPVFVFPLQIARDFSLRAYSPFPDLETPIRAIIISFAQHAPDDARLIIKIHPLDPGLRNWRKVAEKAAEAAGVSARVRYIDGGDLARLIHAAAGVIVVNSTVGLLALQFGCPTIALGQAVYDVAGMTDQSGLDAFWQAPPPPDAALTKAFIQALAGSHMVRGTFYSEPGLTAAVDGATQRLLSQSVNQPQCRTAKA